MERLYSLKNAAEMIGGVSKKTLFVWISQGKLHKTKIGVRTMVTLSELERFVSVSSSGDKTHVAPEVR